MSTALRSHRSPGAALVAIGVSALLVLGPASAFAATEAGPEPEAQPADAAAVEELADAAAETEEGADAAAETEPAAAEPQPGPQTAVLAAEAAPAPAAVPAPAAGATIINVRVGGDADVAAPGDPLPLAGAQLRLYADNAGTVGAALTDSWALCTSDADGDCSFTVPDTAGANAGLRFWVRLDSAPAGWFGTFASDGLQSLRTGQATTITTTPYQFRTPAMMAGSTFVSGTHFMTGGAGVNTDSSGYWQLSRDNPAMPDRCGLRLALVLDLSYSIDATELGQLKQAGVAFVDALEGTPSAIAVYTFADTGPASGPGNSTLGLTSVATSNGADAVRDKINGLSGQAGFTNWDQAMLQVAQSSDVYDALIFVTDGNPTAHGDGIRSPNARTTFNEIERGIFSANAVKAEGATIFGVGILNEDVPVPTDVPLNLQAASGTALDEDYFLVGDFGSLGENLQELALRACRSSVSVVKRVIPAGGAIADGVPAAGWTFTATSAGRIGEPSATTNDSGAVNFGIDLGAAQAMAVTLTETQQPGYELVQQSGANATCTRLDTGAPVPVTNVGALGFTVDTFLLSGVTCQVFNRAAKAPAIELVKTADVTFVDAVGDVITYTFTATNTGDEVLTDVTITDPLPGLSDLVCQQPAAATLQPDEVLTCTATYTVTQADLDAGSIDNVATATGTPPTGPPVEDTDDHTVPATPEGGIAIVKTPSATQVDPGTEVTFAYTVTNTGAVALGDVQVADDKCSPVEYASGDTDADGLLDLDEEWSYTCTSVIAATTTNVATTTGTTPAGDTVTSTDTATVTVTPAPAPAGPTTPQTGSPAWAGSVLYGGLGLIAAGGVLIAARRRPGGLHL